MANFRTLIALLIAVFFCGPALAWQQVSELEELDDGSETVTYWAQFEVELGDMLSEPFMDFLRAEGLAGDYNWKNAGGIVIDNNPEARYVPGTYFGVYPGDIFWLPVHVEDPDAAAVTFVDFRSLEESLADWKAGIDESIKDKVSSADLPDGVIGILKEVGLVDENDVVITPPGFTDSDFRRLLGEALADDGAITGFVDERLSALEEAVAERLTWEHLREAGLVNEDNERIRDTIDVAGAIDRRLGELGLTIEDGQIVLPVPPEFDLDAELAELGFTFEDGRVVFPQGLTDDELSEFTERVLSELPEVDNFWLWASIVGLLLLLLALAAAFTMMTRRSANGYAKQADLDAVKATIDGDGTDDNPGVAKVSKEAALAAASAVRRVEKVEARQDEGEKALAAVLARVEASEDANARASGDGIDWERSETTDLTRVHNGTSTWKVFYLEHGEEFVSEVTFRRDGDVFHTNLPRPGQPGKTCDPIRKHDTMAVKAMLRRAFKNGTLQQLGQSVSRKDAA